MKKVAGIALVAIVLLLLTRKAKAKPGSKFLLDAFYGPNKFKFTTPVGIFTLNNPDTSSPGVHILKDTEKYNLAWQAPLPGLIVVSLVHKTGVVFAEVYSIDLEAQNATYSKEYNQVVVTG